MLEHVQQLITPYKKIGQTLSGGLDSACLLAVIRQADCDKPVSTYTIGYSEDDPEIAGARETASYYETEHNELIFDPLSIPVTQEHALPFHADGVDGPARRIETQPRQC